MNSLAQLIRREAASAGVLSFARFMELALYCPVHGYYEKEKDNPGRAGDFYTSVAVGPLFGQLLAFQFAQWLEATNATPVRILEAGAHDGRLARDILAWLQRHRPRLLEKTEYWILEPSPRRQEWQRNTLRPFRPLIRWFTGFPSSNPQSPLAGQSSSTGLRTRSVSGVIFSNELLDALPVHRFGWDAAAKQWFEWGVAVDGEKFLWTRCRERPSAASMDFWDVPNFPAAPQWAPDRFPAGLLEVLPDGYTVEVCPAAEAWWRAAGMVLAQGRLMTLDYGLTADELFSPARARGTLRGYFRHHLADDVLANVGEQDLTAHVNFSAIQAVGESAGLVTEEVSTQAQFLTRILARAVPCGHFGGMTPAQARQFQTLTHPEHLGRAFRVLVQQRRP